MVQKGKRLRCPAAVPEPPRALGHFAIPPPGSDAAAETGAAAAAPPSALCEGAKRGCFFILAAGIPPAACNPPQKAARRMLADNRAPGPKLASSWLGVARARRMNAWAQTHVCAQVLSPQTTPKQGGGSPQRDGIRAGAAQDGWCHGYQRAVLGVPGDLGGPRCARSQLEGFPARSWALVPLPSLPRAPQLPHLLFPPSCLI